MEVEFELSEEDYIKFNIYHTKKSPSLKKSAIFMRIAGALSFLIFAFIATTISEIPLWYWMIIFGTISIIWLVFYPKYFDWEMKRRLKKMLKEGNNENLYKQTKIILTDNGIVQKSNSGQSDTKWNEIDSVDQTDEYIYIYNSSISAYIIPKRIFKNENERNTFIAELLKYYNDQKIN